MSQLKDGLRTSRASVFAGSSQRNVPAVWLFGEQCLEFEARLHRRKLWLAYSRVVLWVEQSLITSVALSPRVKLSSWLLHSGCRTVPLALLLLLSGFSIHLLSSFLTFTYWNPPPPSSFACPPRYHRDLVFKLLEKLAILTRCHGVSVTFWNSASEFTKLSQSFPSYFQHCCCNSRCDVY